MIAQDSLGYFYLNTNLKLRFMWNNFSLWFKLSLVFPSSSSDLIMLKSFLNVARALYFHSKVHISFWEDCVTTATFIINRTPSSLLKHNSPFNILFNKEPDYHALQSSGCLAFASILSSSRNKFFPKAVPAVFVGYPRGYKGYKLYSLDTKKFFVSRDVVFHESIFPFQTIS